jgi:hypothetical protein
MNTRGLSDSCAEPEVDTALLANSGILVAYPIDYAKKAIDSKLAKHP